MPFPRLCYSLLLVIVALLISVDQNVEAFTPAPSNNRHHRNHEVSVRHSSSSLRLTDPSVVLDPEAMISQIQQSSLVLSNAASGVWTQYNLLLEAQPLATKAVTSFTGFTLGDILAQNFVEEDRENKPYDWQRTLRLGSFGLLLHGTTGHFFYGWLDGQLPGTAPLTVASKVMIDQVFWNPIFGCMFFGYLNFLEGKSLEEYVQKIKNDLQTAVTGSWTVWIPAHCVNFALIPSSQRLLYINTIQIGYNIFLSLLANKSAEDEDGSIEKE